MDENKDKIINIGHSRIFLKDIASYLLENNNELIMFLRGVNTPIRFSFENEYRLREIVELLDKEFSSLFINECEDLYFGSGVRIIYDNIKQT